LAVSTDADIFKSGSAAAGWKRDCFDYRTCAEWCNNRGGLTINEVANSRKENWTLIFD